MYRKVNPRNYLGAAYLAVVFVVVCLFVSGFCQPPTDAGKPSAQSKLTPKRSAAKLGEVCPCGPACECTNCKCRPTRKALTCACKGCECKPAGKRRYGWRRSLPHNAPRYTLPDHLKTPPPVADLRPRMPPVYDQLDLGSCVDQAVAGVLQYNRKAQKLPDEVPSRLFLYWNARALEGSTDSDTGSTVTDGIRSAARNGYCDEKLWPYSPARFAVKPAATAYAAARPNVIRNYAAVTQDGLHIQGAVAAGHPVIFGFTVYDSFESDDVATSGAVPMPGPGEQELGGHCCVIVGYNAPKRTYVVRNSWGVDWGLKGYCTFPFEYVHSGQLSADFWVINTVPSVRNRR